MLIINFIQTKDLWSLHEVKYEHNSSILRYVMDILSHGLTMQNIRCICTRKRVSI